MDKAPFLYGQSHKTALIISTIHFLSKGQLLIIQTNDF